MKGWLVRIIALVVFGVSFALPAIRVNGSSNPNQIAGWTCALFASGTGPKALVESLGQHVPLDDVLVVIAGLVNYLFLAILVLCSWRRLVRIRVVLGALTIPCFIASWMFFVSQKVTPLVGHYLWVAGAVLFVAPDMASLFRRARAGVTAAQETAGR